MAAYSVVSALVAAVVTAASGMAVANELRFQHERPDASVFPSGAPYSPQAAALGKMLFFDPRLSDDQRMSCATCHNPSFGWETPAPTAIGSRNRPLARHAPSVENLGEATALFWDGRAATLEEQALQPITNPLEMNADLDEVVARLSAIEGYRDGFRVAFPDQGLTPETIARAIGAYQRTLRSGMAPFDAWVEGDESAISDAAKRGFDLFVGKANCSSCHRGWAFTDRDYHDVGVAGEDIGRGALDPSTAYRFKTPGLRNIALRAPYMHNGSLASLREVLAHYNAGGSGMRADSVAIAPLDLSEPEVADLLAFLQTLTAKNPHVSAPALPAE